MKRSPKGEKAKRPASLRKRAEAMLTRQGERFDSLTAMELKRLVQELATYQIELEIQNEELNSAQQALEASHRRYSELYEFAPVGYFTFDRSGNLIEANVTGADMLGVRKRWLLKTPFQVFLENNRDRKEFPRFCQ